MHLEDCPMDITNVEWEEKTINGSTMQSITNGAKDIGKIRQHPEWKEIGWKLGVDNGPASAQPGLMTGKKVGGKVRRCCEGGKADGGVSSEKRQVKIEQITDKETN
ncbi:hypothetical protein PAXINDRAFT_155327 [Paxillus involutus ATCC 200175]|uniref:Uncharacterized protein n=1 Tax=Paxillus involutus ATCC 200175 TaxID=664439 RepID=A0A0C9T010_PAXIN|nr:hypothetical protein PAXINDRAFT_155327 [Paxillus involutus ATCC 200175]